jgi:hypothetical protein
MLCDSPHVIHHERIPDDKTDLHDLSFLLKDVVMDLEVTYAGMNAHDVPA